MSRRRLRRNGWALLLGLLLIAMLGGWQAGGRISGGMLGRGGPTAEVPVASPDREARSQSPRSLGAPTALLRLQRAGLVREPGPDADEGYSRTQFGPSLSQADPEHNGCPTREDVMRHDLEQTEIVGACNVVRGLLHDPYTGRDVEYREEIYSGSVQIDHIVALSYAWKGGASAWDKSKRIAFANDQRLNLLAVDGRANAGKGDSGPGEWLPINKAYRCTYVRRWVQVAYAYRVRVAPVDYEAAALQLQHCKAGTS